MAEDKKNSVRTEGLLLSDNEPKVEFENLSLADKEEYIDFLMVAYKDQFNRDKFEKREMVKKFWDWKYLDNPTMVRWKPIIWICRFRDKMVGQICVMPIDLKVGQETYKGGWFQDFIILPLFRNMGIGHSLIQHALKKLNGLIDIVMAAGTNERSYDLFKKAGFLDMGAINRSVYPLNFKNILEKSIDMELMRPFLHVTINAIFKLSHLWNRFHKNENVEVSEAVNFDEGFDSFWLEASKQSTCIATRDKGMLKWRFIDQPYRRYKILTAEIKGGLRGYAVIREANVKSDNIRFGGLKVGIISDIFFDPKEKNIGVSLLNTALQDFNGRVDLVRCDSLSPVIQRTVRTSGFINIKSNDRFLIHLLNEGMINKNGSFLQDRKNWYLTYGDSDIDLY